MEDGVEITDNPAKKTFSFPQFFIFTILISTIFGFFVFFWQNSKVNKLNGDVEKLLLRIDNLQKINDDSKLFSPVDNKEILYSTRKTIGLRLGGTPVDIYLEQYDDDLKGRFIISHAWNTIPNRNEGALVLRDENSGPCLIGVDAVSDMDNLRFVAEYLCGDHWWFKVTSLSVNRNSTMHLKDASISDVFDFDLNDYFSIVYQKSFIEIVGWQDYNHLLIDQILIEESEIGQDNKKHELYLFNVETKEKQLIHFLD